MGSAASILSDSEGLAEAAGTAFADEFLRLLEEEKTLDEEITNDDVIDSYKKVAIDLASKYSAINAATQAVLVEMCTREFYDLKQAEKSYEEIKLHFASVVNAKVVEKRENAETEENFRHLSHTFLVAIDGSASSEVAVSCILKLMKDTDKIVLFHAHKHEDEANSLPEMYRHTQLSKTYEVKLADMVPAERRRMCFIERKAGENAKSILLRLVKLCESNTSFSERTEYFGDMVPDVVVVGFSGVKKEIANSPLLIGSSADLAMKNIHFPMIISKRDIATENRVILFAVDGSEETKQGLKMLFSFLRPSDTVIVAHCQQSALESSRSIFGDTDVEKLEQYYTKELADLSQKGEFHVIPREAGSSIADCVIEKAESVSADYIVLAPTARRQVTNITEEVIRKSPCSVILCKVNARTNEVVRVLSARKESNKDRNPPGSAGTSTTNICSEDITEAEVEDEI
jgi:nucleotide-binding universal stress UspA family protein